MFNSLLILNLNALKYSKQFSIFNLVNTFLFYQFLGQIVSQLYWVIITII